MTASASLALATSPRTPLPQLLRLAEDHPAEVANHPALIQRPDLLAKADLFATLALAACPTAPEQVLRALVVHPRAEVRATVAQNLALGPMLLATLAFDDDAEVRDTARQHPRIGPLTELLGGLKDVPPSTVRGWLMASWEWTAQYIQVHPALLRFLGKRDNKFLALVLANPGCPEPLVGELLVGWLAGRSRPAALAQREGLWHRLYGSRAEWWVDPLVARRMLQHLPAERGLLKRLLSSRVRIQRNAYQTPSDLQVQRLMDVVLAHPSCTRAVLASMSRHALSQVRCEATRHPRFPRAMLAWMLGDPTYAVRRAAWFHPRLPAGWRERLLRLGFAPGLAERPARLVDPSEEDRLALATCGPWLAACPGVKAGLPRPDERT